MVISAPLPNEVSLYFHIPFCRKKCGYCHFYVLPDLPELKEQLETGFFLEWEQKKHLLKDRKLKSIYFGGGTPYLFGPSRISKILELIISFFGDLKDIEVTLEANPENIDFQTLQDFQKAGVNRISLGVQSFEEQELIQLTREHTEEKTPHAVWTCHEAGFKNISIDLMYDVPLQTLDSFKKSLGEALKLPITHLSLYNLTFEPNTAFFKDKQKKAAIPKEIVSKEMYETAISTLEKGEFFQYEISAFAKDNLYSRHNTGYWLGRPFLGFGPSAFSYFEGKRFRNIAHLKKYLEFLKKCEPPQDFEEKLAPDQKGRELLAIALRLTQGCSLKDVEALGGQVTPLLLKELEDLSKQRLLTLSLPHIKLTTAGRIFYDSVAATII